MNIRLLNFIHENKVLSFSFIFFALFSTSLHVFATPPSSPYGAGDTLDPSCAPGDTYCYVGGVSFFNYGDNGMVTTVGQNTFLGITAGNRTMGSTATQSYHASYNTAMGYNSLNSNTTGYENTSFGYDTLYANTTGRDNTAVGKGTLYSNTTGLENLGLGTYTLLNNVSGSYNTAVSGRAALWNNVDGDVNTAVGYGALGTGTTGSYNIGIGGFAGDQSYTGNYNIAIGYQVDFPLDAGSNQLTIGNLIFGSLLDGTEKTVSTGNIGIGDPSPDYRFDVDGNAASTYVGGFFNDGDNDNRYGILIQAGADSPSAGKWIQFNDGDGGDVGTISLVTGTLTLTTTSDQRLKENIEDTSIGLEDLKKIQVRDFNFISDQSQRSIHGFIAQELFEVYPDAVITQDDPDAYWQVSFTHLIPLLVKSIQDLDAQFVEVANLGETFTTKLKSWFASSSNGIQDFFARRVRTKELCIVDDLGNQTCLDKGQIDNLIANQSGAVVYTSAPSQEPEDIIEEEDIPDDEEEITEDEEVIEEAPEVLVEEEEVIEETPEEVVEEDISEEENTEL